MVGDTVQGRAPARIFCAWKEIEANYRKLGPQDEFSMKPRFYTIVNAELNNQEHPKLDGLVGDFTDVHINFFEVFLTCKLGKTFCPPED